MIVWYVVYDSLTGAIKRWGTCPYGMVELQADVGEGALASGSKATGETHYVEMTDPPQLKAK